MIWRNFAAGLKVWAEPFVVVQHGRDEANGYQTGTALEDASGEFVAEVARSRNELYYTRKWGANATDSASIMRVQRSLARPQGCKGAASLAGRFCTRELRPRGREGRARRPFARTLTDPAPFRPPRAEQRLTAGGRSQSGASWRRTARACATAPRARSAASSCPRRSTEEACGEGGAGAGVYFVTIACAFARACAHARARAGRAGSVGNARSRLAREKDSSAAARGRERRARLKSRTVGESRRSELRRTPRH